MGHTLKLPPSHEQISRHLFALARAGDERRLGPWLDRLEALAGRGRLFAGWYGDRLMPRIAPQLAGAPDLDQCAAAWCAAACLDAPPARQGRGRPSRREPDRILAAMRAAYLADIARAPRTGRARRRPPTVPQPGGWGETEPLRCHACWLVGVVEPLVVGFEPALDSGGAGARTVILCLRHGSTLAGSRAATLKELSKDDRDYWKRVYAGDPQEAARRYRLDLRGSVAEVIADFTGHPPEARTVERWIADGRTAFHSLGFWPWAVAAPGASLPRRWWRRPGYQTALLGALDPSGGESRPRPGVPVAAAKI